MHEVFLQHSWFHVAGRGPDKFYLYDVAADGSLLTLRHLRSHIISWYNPRGVFTTMWLRLNHVLGK